MRTLSAALARHLRFYIALGCGVFAFSVTSLFGMDAAVLAGGDVFYFVFLALCVAMIAGQSAADLRTRAKHEDEGIGIVILITLFTMGYFCVAVFTALSRRHSADVGPLAMAGAGALMGWFVLHTVMAFHYADIYYFDDPACKDDTTDLEFPGGGDPGPWEFLYYAFVVGMTAQVSDVQVKTTAMRRATLLHGIVSFFFNTVFIAMAVNAGVSLAA
ncbi:MAG TPA: DUF1345 domain-containing protein [Rhizomicrobium sp.]|jgi:uncharacterized membrane protein|nr:DUF1345 domain-containing protein [Rhizomicrobium sp.]